jgi:hypothetical protein
MRPFMTRANLGTVMRVASVYVLALSGLASAQSTASRVIPTGSKAFIAPMENDFNKYLKAAIEKKKVPLTVVDDRAQAQFEITGHSETEKAGVAKKAFMLDWHSNEQASIQIASIESGEESSLTASTKRVRSTASRALLRHARSTLGKRSRAESSRRFDRDRLA